MTKQLEILIQQGKWDDAIAQCKLVIDAQPVNPKPHAFLGMCFLKKSDLVNAEAAFRRAITLDPNFWEAGIKLAQVLDRQLKYKEALQVAEHYLHMRPNEHALQVLVNGLRRQQGAVEEESWQKSVKGAWHNVTLAND